MTDVMFLLSEIAKLFPMLSFKKHDYISVLKPPLLDRQLSQLEIDELVNHILSTRSVFFEKQNKTLKSAFKV